MAASGTLTIAAGQTSATISIQVVNDLADEPDETLTLALSSPTNATLGTPSSSTITIVDNDDPPYQPAAYDESYAYDKIGNLTSKAGVTQQYGANLNGTGAGPHQVRSRGGASYSYDANGNMTSGGNRSYTWTYENQIASVTVTNYNPETYAYNVDGERVTRSTGTLTTVYEGGLYEHDVQTGRTRVQYALNGQMVAQRTRATGENKVHYMHSDHLGSVSVTTDAQGAVVSRADFTPFGEERSWSGTSPTTLNYTGQRKDATGLLFYNARYYDPLLGRFVSADSIVPASASGSMDDVALKPLTVDFHETGFVSDINFENQQQFWFQMSSDEQKRAKLAWGPTNLQALNRYSYVQNNPLRYNDPTGHNDVDVTASGYITSEKQARQVMALIKDTLLKAGVEIGLGGGVYDVGGSINLAMARLGTEFYKFLVGLYQHLATIVGSHGGWGDTVVWVQAQYQTTCAGPVVNVDGSCNGYSGTAIRARYTFGECQNGSYCTPEGANSITLGGGDWTNWYCYCWYNANGSLGARRELANAGTFDLIFHLTDRYRVEK